MEQQRNEQILFCKIVKEIVDNVGCQASDIRVGASGILSDLLMSRPWVPDSLRHMVVELMRERYVPVEITVAQLVYDLGPEDVADVVGTARLVGDVYAYVSRLEEVVVPVWRDRWTELWHGLLRNPIVVCRVADPGRQRGTVFNRNLVANILHRLHGLAVLAEGSPTVLTIMLEGSRDHPVRAALGLEPDFEVRQAADKVVKSLSAK